MLIAGHACAYEAKVAYLRAPHIPLPKPVRIRDPESFKHGVNAARSVGAVGSANKGVAAELSVPEYQVALRSSLPT